MIKYHSLILPFILFLNSNNPVISGEGETKIKSYDIELLFDAASQQLDIKACMNTGPDLSSNNISLIFNPDTENLSVKTFIENKEYRLDFEKMNNDSLKIFQTEEAASLNEINLCLEYSIPADTSLNCITLYRWFPYVMDNIATWKISAEIPKYYYISSAGDIVGLDSTGKNLVIKIEQPESIPYFSLVLMKSGVYDKFSSNAGGTEINYFFLNKSEGSREAIISTSVSAFTFYSTLIGKYRYGQLNLCEIPDIQYINSQPSIILMGSIFITYFDKGLNQWPAHEMAHQWIGSGVLVKPSDTNKACISESLAEYLKFMYIESIYGKDSLNSILKNCYDTFKKSVLGTAGDIPLFNARSERVLYLKGPIIMDKIRSETGKENWNKFLNGVYEKFKGSFFSYYDFIDVLQNYCSDKDFLKKIDGWMHQKGRLENFNK